MRTETVSRAEFRRLMGLAADGPGAGGPRANGGRGAHVPGAMNRTEARYAEWLEVRRRAGEIRAWRFEGVTLRLAPRTTYTPDFVVVSRTGETEIHEVKGHVEDDWRVKWKWARKEFWWWRFVWLRWRGGEWMEREG